MNPNEKQPPVNPAAQQGQQGQQQYFPPPPPGPPPAQTAQGHPPKHTNDTPLPDYDIPTYQPGHPQFAPPQKTATDDFYNASPTDERPPKWGFHRPAHDNAEDGEKKKKGNRLSAFGEAFASKVAGPVNAMANKFGSEGFLPESLDKECEKASRILRGFCKDGIYSDVVGPTDGAAAAAVPTDPSATSKPPPSPSAKPKKSRVLLTIPSKVIARAQGLAIFTAVRLGFQATGSSGSGILLSRLPNGNWSPPSAIQITSIGAGFVAGVDIYDCVIVINTREALELFTKTRLSLGSDLAVTAGPFGAGGALDWGVPGKEGQSHKRTGSGVAGEKDSGLPPPAGAAPLSADNTHFQTAPIIPENQQGMGSDDEHNPHPHHRPLSSGKDKIDRKPSPFRDAMRKPVYSYVKSRGFYAGVQIDGTVIAARDTANAKFYGAELPVGQILAGQVPQQGPAGMWPAGAKGLFDVVRGAESGHGGLAAGPQQQHQHHGAGAGGVGFGGPSPAFGAPVGGGGAPASAWVPPPQGPAQGARGGVATGVHNPGVARKAVPGSSAQAVPPPGPAPAMSAGASAKAAEAAAEGEAARAENAAGAGATGAAGPPPPVYEDVHGQGQVPDDLPPAYVEDERYRAAGAGGDSKTGLH